MQEILDANQLLQSDTVTQLSVDFVGGPATLLFSLFDAHAIVDAVNSGMMSLISGIVWLWHGLPDAIPLLVGALVFRWECRQNRRKIGRW